MTEKKPKRPRDLNQWAKRMADIATGEVEEDKPSPSTPAQEFAREGGLKGGRARADKLFQLWRVKLAHYPKPSRMDAKQAIVLQVAFWAEQQMDPAQRIC